MNPLDKLYFALCDLANRFIHQWRRWYPTVHGLIHAGSWRKLSDTVGKSVDQLDKLVEDKSKLVRLAAIRIVLTARLALKTEIDFEARLARLERGGSDGTNTSFATAGA